MADLRLEAGRSATGCAVAESVIPLSAISGRYNAPDRDYLAAQLPISKTTVPFDGVAVPRDCAILSLESDTAFPGLFAIDISLLASSRKKGGMLANRGRNILPA